MLVLVTPRKGLAGFIFKSMIGGKDFAFVSPDDGIFKPKVMTGQFEIFGEYKFPDTAKTSEFDELLIEVAQGYNEQEDGDYDEWYTNKVRYAAEAYLAQLTPEESEDQGETKKNTRRTTKAAE